MSNLTDSSMVGGPKDAPGGGGVVGQLIMVAAVGLGVVGLFLIAALLTSEESGQRLVALGVVLGIALVVVGLAFYRRANRPSIHDSLSDLTEEEE
jgi:Kef-type K+ transport system membrane component KefB